MKKFLVVITILSVLSLIIYLKFKGTEPAEPRGPSYAGSAACARCHGDIYHSYLHTAHYLASLPASSKTVHGRFSPPSNVFEFSPSQKIAMEKRDSGMFQ